MFKRFLCVINNGFIPPSFWAISAQNQLVIIIIHHHHHHHYHIRLLEIDILHQKGNMFKGKRNKCDNIYFNFAMGSNSKKHKSRKIQTHKNTKTDTEI